MCLRRHAEHLVAGCFAAVLLAAGGAAAEQDNWPAVVAEARGQTVYFNAWGGELTINRYLQWATDRLREDHNVELRHVKVTDIAEAVARVRAERAAGSKCGTSENGAGTLDHGRRCGID